MKGLPQLRARWAGWPAAVRWSLIALALVAGVIVLPGGIYVRTGRACNLCHTAPVDSHLAVGKHEGVACRECHAISTFAVLRKGLKAVVRSTTPGPTHGWSGDSSCGRCHDAASPAWDGVARTAGHGPHLARGIACSKCHAANLHRDESTSAVCGTCHSKKAIHSNRMPNVPCTTCHNFVADKGQGVPTTRHYCLQCHSRPQGDPKAAALSTRAIPTEGVHGTVDCKLCHAQHEGAQAGARTGRDCTQCHKVDIQLQLQAGPEGHKKCEGCHQPHTLKSEFRRVCTGCHEIARATEDKPTTASKHAACSDCHKPHTWVANKSACYDCHLQRAQEMATPALAGHAECAGCHKPHSPIADSNRCIECHKDRSNQLTAAPQPHRNCMACHAPHSDRSAAREACARCHGAQLAAVHTGPVGHRSGCPQCHQPHGSPGAPPQLCAKCHTDKAGAVTAAGPEPHRTCSSCHQQHRFSIPSSADACGRCHANVRATSGAHQGDCRSCHNPHGSPLVAQAACQKCHSNVSLVAPAKAPVHGRCGTCHSPHQAARSASSKCGQCHGDKVAVSAQWKQGSAHAGPCVGCHDQHAVERKKSCTTCHATQASTFSAGRHKACTQCHAPHASPGNWWSKCGQCHKAQQAGASHGGPTHRACDNCHKPHKFSRASCTSCHNALAGLHRQSNHASCVGCHETHGGGAAPQRDRCIKCHKDRTMHQPEAKACYGCHLFK